MLRRHRKRRQTTAARCERLGRRYSAAFVACAVLAGGGLIARSCCWGRLGSAIQLP
jgi:hypothetical protein